MYVLNKIASVIGIASALAVICTVLAFIFVVPEKKVKGKGAFMRFLHDTVDFKYLIIEKILQALYIFTTCLVIGIGFFMLFMTVDNWYSKTWLGGYGLLLMILGPILVRLSYELLMMMILLVKNVISINEKLGSKSGESGKNDVFSPDASAFFGKKTSRDGAVPPAGSCTKCGAELNPDGSCPNCGVQQ